MKKNILKITISFITLILIFTMFYSKPIKAVSTTLSASSATVTSGENFSVTITSSTSLSGWTIGLSSSGGCTFSSASVSGGAMGEIDGTRVLGISTGTKTLATYNFKAPTVTKDTTYTISFSGTAMADESGEVVNDASCTATVTVKAKSTSSSGGSNNSSSSGSSSSSSNSNNTTTKTPTFKSVNQTVYTTKDCNLRASWSTSSTATSVKAGTELTLTGTSTQTVNGYTWYRVTYNGATRYIASHLITYDKPEEDDEESSNKNLSSLSIEGVELTPAFDKDTTQYTATVDGDVTELKIDAKAEDSKATVAIEGNEELKEGDNIIKIKVTAEDNTTRTYFITITKGEGTVTDDTLKLSELVIERVNFEGAFDPDIYTYELSLNTYVENLEITATPNQADATVEIIGNSDFQVGENVVTILITSADGTQTATYQIKVNIAEGVVEEKSELGTVSYIIIGVVIAAVIIGIYLFIRYRKIKKGKMTNSEETDINFMSRYTTNEEEKTEKRKTSKKEKSDVTVDDFLNEASEDENSEKSKKPKGRHSK